MLSGIWRGVIMRTRWELDMWNAYPGGKVNDLFETDISQGSLNDVRRKPEDCGDTSVNTYAAIRNKTHIAELFDWCRGPRY